MKYRQGQNSFELKADNWIDNVVIHLIELSTIMALVFIYIVLPTLIITLVILALIGLVV